jgi:hypothetical protein
VLSCVRVGALAVGVISVREGERDWEIEFKWTDRCPMENRVV